MPSSPLPALHHAGAPRCVVAPGAMPSEPGLRAHLQRMHELRPGLHLHSDDAHDARDLTAQTEIGVGLRIVLLLEGAVDVSYGGERVALSSSRGSVSACMVAVAEPDLFTRRAHRGVYSRRVNLGLERRWLEQACGGADGRGTGPLEDFMRRHLATRRWQLSARGVALAEQIVRPPQLNPLLQNMYLESRALELVSEAVGALYAHPGAALPTAGEASGLRPREYQRMRELHAFLGSGQGDHLSLDGIARHAGVNANTLQRQFRAVFGTTVFDHLRECRLQRARHALEHDGLTVGQAAVLAGYTSAANFATAYRRRFGMPPKLARARI